MKRAPFPVPLDGRAVATVAMSSEALVARLGPRHALGESPEYAGPTDLWAFQLNDGTYFVVESAEAHRGPRDAVIVCERGKLDAVLTALGNPAVPWRAES